MSQSISPAKMNPRKHFKYFKSDFFVHTNVMIYFCLIFSITSRTIVAKCGPMLNDCGEKCNRSKAFISRLWM